MSKIISGVIHPVFLAMDDVYEQLINKPLKDESGSVIGKIVDVDLEHGVFFAATDDEAIDESYVSLEIIKGPREK